MHTLIRIAADALAAQQWRTAGARSVAEMRAFIIGRMRRRMGMAAVQAMARHRLSRISYIGVPRQAVMARRRHGAAAPYAPAANHGNFFAFQAGAQGMAVRAAA